MTIPGGEVRVAAYRPPGVPGPGRHGRRARRQIKQAAAHRARLVALPEAIIPGYPDWVWRRPAWSYHGRQARRSASSARLRGEAATSWPGSASGLRGIDATLTLVATGAIPRSLIQPTRGWSDDDWEQSVRRLQARGLLDRGGRLTKTGGTLRREVEDLTDRLAAGPVERLGETGVRQAIDLATPVSRHLIDSGLIPVPNPIGAPRP